MRAAQSVRIGKPREPPAFAPVISLICMSPPGTDARSHGAARQEDEPDDQYPRCQLLPSLVKLGVKPEGDLAASGPHRKRDDLDQDWGYGLPPPEFHAHDERIHETESNQAREQRFKEFPRHRNVCGLTARLTE